MQTLYLNPDSAYVQDKRGLRLLGDGMYTVWDDAQGMWVDISVTAESIRPEKMYRIYLSDGSYYDTCGQAIFHIAIRDITDGLRVSDMVASPMFMPLPVFKIRGNFGVGKLPDSENYGKLLQKMRVYRYSMSDIRNIQSDFRIRVGDSVLMQELVDPEPPFPEMFLSLDKASMLRFVEGAGQVTTSGSYSFVVPQPKLLEYVSILSRVDVGGVIVEHKKDSKFPNCKITFGGKLKRNPTVSDIVDLGTLKYCLKIQALGDKEIKSISVNTISFLF